jgi:hypothetical protein
LTAHFVWPVMKLPGRMLVPCRIQMHPTIRHKTPATFNVTRIVGRLWSGDSRRRKNEAETVWVAKPKDPYAPGVSRLGIEYRARALDVGCEGVDILRGGDLERESFPLDAIESPCAIVLRQDDANRSRPQADREQPALALKFAVHREAEYVAIPRKTPSSVGHGEGRVEALRE